MSGVLHRLAMGLKRSLHAIGHAELQPGGNILGAFCPVMQESRRTSLPNYKILQPGFAPHGGIQHLKKRNQIRFPGAIGPDHHIDRTNLQFGLANGAEAADFKFSRNAMFNLFFP
jgi:hypothetical protein